jgi:hypothetical protein
MVSVSKRPSPISDALERGRLLACHGVCGAILANRHPRRDADGFPLFTPDFAPQSALPASLSLFDADLSNPSASREISRFVCFAEGALPAGIPTGSGRRHGETNHHGGVRTGSRFPVGWLLAV